VLLLSFVTDLNAKVLPTFPECSTRSHHDGT